MQIILRKRTKSAHLDIVDTVILIHLISLSDLHVITCEIQVITCHVEFQ